MKNSTYKFLATLAILFLALAACEDKNDFGEGYTPSLLPIIELTVLPPSEFSDTGGEQKLTVTCNTSDWTVKSNNTSWCTVEKTSNTEIKVTATENDSTGNRSATITFSYGSETLNEITVTQKGKGFHTIATPGEGFPVEKDGVYTLDSPDATTLTINVTSNEKWTATSSNTNLCTVSPDEYSNNGKVTVAVKQNTTKDSRTATLTIKGTNSSDNTTIRIVQPGITFALKEPLSEFLAEGGEQTSAVTCNSRTIDWSVKSSDTLWCTVEKTSNSTIKVTATKNTSTERRKATVTFYYGSETLNETNVDQQGEGKQTSATPGKGFPAMKDGFYTLDSPDATTLTINVTSNESWTATSSNTALCTVSPEESSNKGEVTVTVKKNTTISEREATVTIEGKDSKKPTDIKIKQPGATPNLEVSPSETIQFDADGKCTSSSNKFTITGNVEWTLSSDATWCHPTTDSGNGNKEIAVTVDKYDNTTQREATITIEPTDNSLKEKLRKTISVTQAGVYYTKVTSSTTITLDKPDEVPIDITIKSNDDWTAQITDNPDNCCTLEKPKDGKGSGDGKQTIKLTRNTTEDLRTVKVTITGENSGIPITVSVNQPGTSYYITIDPVNGKKDRTVKSEGDTLAVTVSTNDTSFEPKCKQSWCKIKDKTDKGFKLEVEPNGTISTRTAIITVTSKSEKTDTMKVTQKAGDIGIEEYD